MKKLCDSNRKKNIVQILRKLLEIFRKLRHVKRGKKTFSWLNSKLFLENKNLKKL